MLAVSRLSAIIVSNWMRAQVSVGCVVSGCGLSAITKPLRSPDGLGSFSDIHCMLTLGLCCLRVWRILATGTCSRLATVTTCLFGTPVFFHVLKFVAAMLSSLAISNCSHTDCLRASWKFFPTASCFVVFLLILLPSRAVKCV